jgi:hypothetical protein
MQLLKGRFEGSEVAGTPAIAAPGAPYAVGFSCFGAKTPNPDRLPALRAVRPRYGCMIDRDEENGQERSTHQPDRLTQNSRHCRHIWLICSQEQDRRFADSLQAPSGAHLHTSLEEAVRD